LEGIRMQYAIKDFNGNEKCFKRFKDGYKYFKKMTGYVRSDSPKKDLHFSTLR
jgi:hypothetical protein